MIKKIIGIGVFLLIIGAGWGGYAIGKGKPHPVPVVPQTRTVPVVKIEPQKITQTRNYIGFVQTPQQVAITPHIAGYVAEVCVKGGENVKKGDVLFILDQRSLLADLAAAVAERAQAEAKLANAQSYFERLEKTKKQAVSAANLDTAKADYKTAQGAVMAARARQRQAEINYTYTYLTAPFDGVLGDVSLAVGDYVTPEKALALLVQTSPVRVQFAVPFADKAVVPTLRQSWQATIRTTDGHPLLTQGGIAFTDNQINTETGSLTVYADFQNPDSRVLSGAPVQVHFEQVERGVLIPKNTVQQTPTGAFSYVLKDGKIQRLPITIAGSVGENYRIIKGLLEGESLVTSPMTERDIGQSAVGVSE